MNQELTLFKTLIYTRMLPDISTINLFNNRKFIFVNNFNNTNLSYLLFKNDVISLIITLWYYMVYK